MEHQPLDALAPAGNHPPATRNGVNHDTAVVSSATTTTTTAAAAGDAVARKQRRSGSWVEPPAATFATGAVPRGCPPVARADAPPNDVIFVTGFGPFGQHVVNASWEAVSRLYDLAPHRKFNARLVIEEVPVEYEYVAREIPRRWRLLRPRLVVHVGVSAQTMKLQLERHAHNGPYQRCDIAQRTPAASCCRPGLPELLSSGLNLQRACTAVANSGVAVAAETSEDAGRYLCDFIYYTSLSHDPARAVFVHVPPLGMPYLAQQIAEGLSVVIEELYGQVLASDRAAFGESAQS